MSKACVSGIGEVAPVSRSGRCAESLVCEAVKAAIADAGISADMIGAVVTESGLMPRKAPHDRITAMTGIANVRYAIHSSPVGAGILAAVGMAADLVSSSKVEHALVYFGIDWGSNPEGPADYHAGMKAKSVFESPPGFVGPALYFAVAARRYQHLHRKSDAAMQEMLWQVAGAARYNASLNPQAQKQRMFTREQYLATPMIAEPLRSADCSLLSDGACALVISSAGAGSDRHPQVTVRGWSYSSDPVPDVDFYTQSPWLPALPAASRSSAAALRSAGLSLAEIDAFEVYDCFSIAVVMQLEALGLCEPGGGADLVADGALRVGSALPTNTHGGLLGHGYLLGAAHVVEAVKQLRGTAGANQVAVAKNIFVGAGPGRQYTSLVLGR